MADAALPVWCWEIQQEPGQVSIQSISLPDECRGLDLISSCLPGGSYTTFRTYKQHYALLLGDHLRRLESSAVISGKNLHVNFESVRQGLRLAIAEIADQGQRAIELRFRLTLDLEQEAGRVFISAEKLHTPEERAYAEGVRLVTCQVQRSLPEAKLTGFIQQADAQRQTLPSDVYEALMVDGEGRLTEGLSSNFFAVWDGVLWTAGEGVLPGVTRSLALETAHRLGLPVRLEGVRVWQLDEIQEAFITSSSRGVLPVVQVDQAIVGEGSPGALTRSIAAEFERLVQEKLEPI
jgi:branched-chain amino acid aminotransferase